MRAQSARTVALPPFTGMARTTTSAGQGVDAVERALSILSAFRDGDAALSLAELAKRPGLYKSTILRLIASLERYGFLMSDATGRYRIGHELPRLGALFYQAFELESMVRPVLGRLVERTQETAAFYVPEGDVRICLYRVNSPRAVRHHLEEGAHLPLDRGAAEQVLLAFGGGKGTLFATIRKAGSYASCGERDPDVAATAVPVFDSGGALRGALSVSGLLTRFDEGKRSTALAFLGIEAAALAKLLPPG
jgi:DNA-binding IclR family transcriptional regulator